MARPGVRQKGLDNMKQISTGAGLLGLGVCMLGTAFIATHRGSGEAFAQVTGGERHIVSANVMMNGNYFVAWRMWSDNAIDVRLIGERSQFACGTIGSGGYYVPTIRTASEIGSGPCGYSYDWKTLDNGTSGFRPLTDVDMSGETDAGDISQVLLDFNTRSDDLPPPPIDCTINAPR